MNLSDEAAADLGELLQEQRREAGPCRCRVCGPNDFEMRVAERARELEVAR